MRLNRNKLPIKYALDIYQDILGYPSHSDLEYLLVSTLQNKDLLGKDFTVEQVWDGMKHVMPLAVNLTEFLENLSKNHSSSDKAVIPLLSVTKSTPNSYQVTGHPWMN